MRRNAGNRAARLQIEAELLLLVEGRDEVNLFDALLGHRHGDGTQIQIIDAGGVNRFPRNLRTIRDLARSRPPLRSIGVVRDADNDAEGAFRSVCNHLRNVGYVPPGAHGEFSDDVPSVGVFIVPDGARTGAIETLCRRSVGGTDAAACVDAYLECLEGRDAMHSPNADKSFAHAYLAATDNPVARVGEAALGGVWNLDSPAFSELFRFLRHLAAQGA